MSDIIERLRDHRVGLGHGTCMDCYGNTMDDAADVIERLQNALMELLTDIDDIKLPEISAATLTRARQALVAS